MMVGPPPTTPGSWFGAILRGLGFAAALIVLTPIVSLITGSTFVAWLVFLAALAALPVTLYLHAQDVKVGPIKRGPSPEEVEAQIEAFRRSGRNALPEHVMTWAIGAKAEEKVGAILDRLGAGYEVAHDIEIWGHGRVKANIDHLVWGPPCGLIMIDTKMWKGELFAHMGRFASADDMAESGPRGKSVETLRWEASQLAEKPSLIVVAVHGRGTVRDGAVMLDTPGEIPVVAVKDNDLEGLLRRVRGQSTSVRPGIASALASPHLSLSVRS